MDQCTRVMHYFSWSTFDKWWWVCRKLFKRHKQLQARTVFPLSELAKMWFWEACASVKLCLLTSHLQKSPVFAQNGALVMQTAVWFQCNSSQLWCQRGLVTVVRLNQYLQQLQRNFTFKPSEFSWLLNLSEITFHHLLAGFSSRPEHTVMLNRQMVQSLLPVQRSLWVWMMPL